MQFQFCQFCQLIFLEKRVCMFYDFFQDNKLLLDTQIGFRINY